MRTIKFFIALLVLAAGWLACKRVFLFDANIAQSEITEVVLLKVEHPLLGGVLKRQSLAAEKIASLFGELQEATAQGPTKLFTCYVIQIKTQRDQTIALRTNGKLFARTTDDYFYQVRDAENLITKYWGENPACQSAVAKTN